MFLSGIVAFNQTAWHTRQVNRLLAGSSFVPSAEYVALRHLGLASFDDIAVMYLAVSLKISRNSFLCDVFN